MRAAALIALLASGCSLTLIKAPPAEPKPEVYARCHEGAGPIVADGFLAVLAALGAVAMISDDPEPEGDNKGAAAVYGVIAGLYTLSAVTGVRWTSRCKRMHDDWERANPGGPVQIAPLHRPTPKPAAAEGALGAACYPNRTCNDGLACGPGQRCVAGDRGLEGRSCFDDGSCSGDLACSSGMCTRPPPAECTTDAHCPEGLGLVCQGGYCVSPPVAP